MLCRIARNPALSLRIAGMEGNGSAVSGRLLGPEEGFHVTGYCDSRIRELIELDEFPAPIPRRNPLSRRAWHEAEIEAWRRGAWRRVDREAAHAIARPPARAAAAPDAQWSPDVIAVCMELDEHSTDQQAVDAP